MASPFVIPTAYTAVDKNYTRNVNKMSTVTGNFAAKTEASFARVDRQVNKLVPGLRDGSKQMLNFARSAAIFAAVIATINFSGRQVMAYEDNINSFRTIVSDLTDKEFAAYREQVTKVALDTHRSSVMVAQSFESIAGLNAEFAKTSTGLAMVSEAAITLSKASKMELQPASESLVGMMNQFQLAADQSSRVINVLAAGTAVGAASISQSSESMKNFGSTAAGANISLEETEALIQVMAKYSLVGAEAGTKLRGSVVRLQQAGVGYASGQFQLSDALSDVTKKMSHLRTAKEKDAYLNKVFGAENISTGRILLDNIATYKEFTAAVTGTSEAEKAAAINSNSLSNRITELQAKWVTLITTSDKTTDGLSRITKAVVFVTEHMEALITTAALLAGAFVAYKGIMLGAKAAMIGYNVVLGISTALQGKSAFYTMGSTVAYGAFRTAVVLGTVAQWALNAAMAVGLLPIIAIVAGIGLLIAVIYSVVKRTKGWGEQWDEITKWMSAVWDAFKSGLLLGFKLIHHSFMNMVDGIVLAWKWGQNLIGNLSDEQFARDKARIKAERDMRVQSIHDTFTELKKATIAANQLPAWKLGWKTAGDIRMQEFAENNVPFPARVFKSEDKPVPRLSTAAAKEEIRTMRSETTERSTVDINVKAQPGTADVKRSNNAPPVTLVPTIGAF